MTVFEMHIEIEQKLQELFSSKHDRIPPEAKDLALRQAEEQIIKQNTDVRFEDRETKLKNIEAILEKNRTFDVFIPQVTDYNYEADTVYIGFPADFQYGVNYRTEVITKNIDCDVPAEVSTTTIPEYITILPFPVSQLSVGPYYNGFKITAPALVDPIYSLPTALLNRCIIPEQRYEIIANVLDTLNYPGATRQVYWEEYKTIRRLGCFIFVSTQDDTSLSATSYQANGTTLDVQTTASTSPTQRTGYDRNSLANRTDISINIRPIKLIEADAHYKMQNLNAFTKSKKHEPHAVASDSFLYVYTGKSFIVTRVTLDYIRKPRQISLVLGQTSELDSSIHRELVDRAVEILKKNIQDPTLTSDVQYNELRTRN